MDQKWNKSPRKGNFQKTQLHSQAKWAANGESISKYWSKINSPKKPCNVIHSLRIPNSNHFTAWSDKMAEIPSKHHENLQKENLIQEVEDLRQTAIKNAMKEIPNEQKLNNPNSPLYDTLEEHHIHEALYSSKC
jgi:hypothetical protein